jgi:hypothetical protein
MRTDRQKDGQANVMKLIAAFRNFANAPKREAVQECATAKHFVMEDSTNSVESRIGCLEKRDTLKFVVIYFMAYCAINYSVLLLIIFLRHSCVFK